MEEKDNITEQENINNSVTDNENASLNEEEANDNNDEIKPKKKFFGSSKKPKSNEVEELKQKLADSNDRFIRMSAEFDNYKKRTLKEKMEIIKAGGETILCGILPVIDDFERAIKSMNQTEDISAVKEGINLIYSKFKEFVAQKGIKEIDAQNIEFNTDFHEAVTKIPAPNESMKGKIVDVIQKGYLLNDKVIRYSQVVIGE